MTQRSSAKTKAEKKPTPVIELVNPGTAGIVYDEAGHSLGGGDRASLGGDPDKVAMRQLEAGHLLAQRGDAWLVVRDGKLVDPNADAAADGADDAEDDAPESVPAPRTDTAYDPGV